MAYDRRKYRYFACDFETTVYPEGQEQDETEVWASAAVELYQDDVSIFHSIDETFDYFTGLHANAILYYHNLRFDGSFWLNFLIFRLKFKPACTIRDETPEYQGTNVKWKDRDDMLDNTFSYHISAQGLWYMIVIKVAGKIIELRDSYKLIPFSIKNIGEGFRTKHRKLDMEYKGMRFAGCEITDSEKEYIANDVLVLKEALEFMFDNGHNKLTIGSCCLSEFKNLAAELPGKDYKDTFPDVYQMPLDGDIYGAHNMGLYVWRAYKGGWCYLCDGKSNKVYSDGLTLDVNSLYPFVMHSASGNRYPYGRPHFWSGNFIPQDATRNSRYFFIRIRTRFYLKKGKIPFIQIKGSMYYKATECLKDSDRRDRKTGERIPFVINFDGEVEDTRVTLTLTMTDFQLLKEQYNLYDFEILDGCWFESWLGFFDGYLDKYAGIKMTSEGAMRTLAKLFMNNLYGKMAASTDSSFKFAYIKEGDENSGVLGFYRVDEDERTPGYIPIGAAITSYARNYTIRTAQMNYHGKNKPGFIYADTDSIHCDLPLEKVRGVRIHDTELGAWKCESIWDRAIFVRQKTYIEHEIMHNMKKLEKPKYNIKCAGMPERCKKLLEWSLEGRIPDGRLKELGRQQREFLFDGGGRFIKREMTDFKKGLRIYGKLIPKMIKGGILLTDTTYELK